MENNHPFEIKEIKFINDSGLLETSDKIYLYFRLLTIKKNKMNKQDYLIKNVFIGLKNLNNGFDARSIYYFSENDFEILLDRVEKLGIEILGIEPWKNGEFYDIMTAEDFNSDSKWYRKAFSKFKEKDGNLQYSASYKIPS